MPDVLSSLESGLVSNLLTDHVVGGLLVDRVHPDFLPQNAVLPAVVYSIISGSREEPADFDSFDASSGTMAVVRFQLDVYSTSKLLTSRLIDSVDDALLRTNRQSFWGGVKLQDIIRTSVADLSDIQEDRAQWRVVSEYEVNYLEP